MIENVKDNIIVVLVAFSILLMITLSLLFFKKGQEVAKVPEHGSEKLADISIPIPAAEPEVEVVVEEPTEEIKQPPIIVVSQPPSPTNIQPVYP